MLFQVKKFAQAQNCLLPMGVTSENVAQRFGVSRQEQDQAAVRELNFFSMVVF
jgi:acetyl-CoA acyltransferase 1